MPELPLLHQISHIVHTAPAFTWALERTRALLAREAGLTLLLADLDAGQPLARPEVRDFLAAPSRTKLLFPMPLLDNGRELGRLVAGFTSPALDAETAARLARFAGEQLGALLGRARLRSRRTALRHEVAGLKRDLEERKTIARAEGLLATRHGLTAQQARLWLETQSRAAGKPAAHIAEQLVLLHTQAVRLTA